MDIEIFIIGRKFKYFLYFNNDEDFFVYLGKNERTVKHETRIVKSNQAEKIINYFVAIKNVIEN
jgi:hypothetical protein